MIHEIYQKDLRKQLEGVNVSIIFDGSTRLGEAFALVVRYVTDDLKVVQRLASLKCIAKSMKSADVCWAIIDCVMEVLHVSRHLITAAIRDGAS